MYQIDFNKKAHVHFIGIGGISMSGLAEILLKEGFRISGSDAHPSQLTSHLEQLGARITSDSPPQILTRNRESMWRFTPLLSMRTIRS